MTLRVSGEGEDRLARVEPLDHHGLPAIRWRSDDGASVVATLQGAHVVSWIPSQGEERLFVSARSPFVAGKAIRGGIPVCFPQFADRGALAQHGFARNLPWRIEGDGLVLESSGETRAQWPHDFRLRLGVGVGGARLAVTLVVENTGSAPFEFTAALHTYLRVASASTARLHGLQGVRFLTRGERETALEGRDSLTAEQPIDRIYFGAPPSLRLDEGDRSLRITQQGFTDTVVWNPGGERAAAMPDMEPGGHARMLCVEAAAVEPPVRLVPGARWNGEQVLVARRDA